MIILVKFILVYYKNVSSISLPLKHAGMRGKAFKDLVK